MPTDAEMGRQMRDPGDPSRGAVSSDLSGSAQDVVQARDISGGVHFHTAPLREVPIPRQLPADVPGFVGRVGSLEQLAALADDGATAEGRLIVIAGTAGAGKTALTLRFAHRRRARFPDGQLFVNLRGYDVGSPLAPAAALERFLRALGTPPEAIPTDVEARAELYRSLLSDRRVLIVLDNAATAGQVRPLLPGEPGCLVVVTTRGRLSGLSARDGARRLTLGLLSDGEAVELIGTVTAGYRHGDAPGQVAELARLCARLPLALRIASERAAARPLMPLRELIADLRGESSLWDALAAEEDTEADTVRSVFAWSYRALPPAAARVFRLLGLHPGSDFGIGAAAALTGTSPNQVKAHLDLLAGAHLLEQTAAARYQFHDLLRAYAFSQAHLEESVDHRQAVLLRTAQWYLRSAHAASQAVQSLYRAVSLAPDDSSIEPLGFADRTAAMEWYSIERANLLALVRVVAVGGPDMITWKLAATLYPLHAAQGTVDDWLESAALGLAAARRLEDTSAQAALQQIVGMAYRVAGDLAAAATCHHAAFELFTVLDDQHGVLEAGNSLGLIHLERRELQHAAERFEQGIALARDSALHQWSVTLLDNLAGTHAEAGRFEAAADLAKQALDLCRSARIDPWLHIDPLLTLTRVNRETGQLERAETHLSAAAQIIASGIMYRSLEYAVRREQAALSLALGEREQSLGYFQQCLNISRTLGDHRREGLAFDGIGQALRALDRTEEAVSFHRTACALLRERANPCDTAEALTHLAVALLQTGHAELATAVVAEAQTVLSTFTDSRAAALRIVLSDLVTAGE
jgi:tetratricopeptide (TPR) repeat protein